MISKGKPEFDLGNNVVDLAEWRRKKRLSNGAIQMQQIDFNYKDQLLKIFNLCLEILESMPRDAVS